VANAPPAFLRGGGRSHVASPVLHGRGGRGEHPPLALGVSGCFQPAIVRACARLGLVANPRKAPAQFNCGRQFAFSLKYLSDHCGVSFADFGGT
jgi:hypothetical protein